MGIFESRTLPRGIVDVEERLKKINRECTDIADRINRAEEANDHQCDCEYCPIDENDALHDNELNDLEDQLDSLTRLGDEMKTSLRRLTDYQEFIIKNKRKSK